MKILKAKMEFRVTLACVLFLLIAALSCNAADIDDSLAKCAAIQDDNAARLKCFDDLAKRQIPVKDITMSPAQKAVTQKSATANPAEISVSQIPDAKENDLSVMEKQWDMSLDPQKRNTFVLASYHPNYLMPLAYNSSPNRDSDLDFDPNAKAQYNEVKFQLSFKVKPWGIDIKGMDVLKGIDVWIAYTQLSFWQLYNSAFSAPFRDTNYEPELLLNFRTQYKIPVDFMNGTKLQFINIGFNHQSNGRSEPLSRSWNRIVANVGLERNNFGLLLKTWYRIPEDETNDDNPDISRYVGYGELLGTLYWKKQRFAVMLRNNLRSENVGAVQLDWSFPLPLIGDKLCGYIQYFNGYGEGLLDYNKSINRISAGFMLVDWK